MLPASDQTQGMELKPQEQDGYLLHSVAMFLCVCQNKNTCNAPYAFSPQENA